MTRFHLRAKPLPDEVTVAIAGDGVMATVLMPERVHSDVDRRDLRLSTALHYAGAIAGELGTDVAILDDTDSVFFIEDTGR